MELDVAAAAAATLPSHTISIRMGLNLGREAAVSVDAKSAFGALTRHLPLPAVEEVDPAAIRRRAPAANLVSGTGHVDPAVEAAHADEAAQARGPGTCIVVDMPEKMQPQHGRAGRTDLCGCEVPVAHFAESAHTSRLLVACDAHIPPH